MVGAEEFAKVWNYPRTDRKIPCIASLDEPSEEALSKISEGAQLTLNSTILYTTLKFRFGKIHIIIY